MNDTTNTAHNFIQARSTLSPLSSISSGFISIAEAAAMTKTSKETIHRAVRSGQIAAYGTRGRTRVKMCDVMPLYVYKGIGTHQ